MSLPQNPVILIPARMASERLPGKPLANLHGQPMIVQVWNRAMEADVGPVFVAAAEPEIVEAVEQAGGRAVLTDPAHPQDRTGFLKLSRRSILTLNSMPSSTYKVICRPSIRRWSKLCCSH